MPFYIELYTSKDNKRFFATCPELSLSCEGKTADEAVEKLQKNIFRFLAQQANVTTTSSFDVESSSKHYYSGRVVQVH